MTSQTCHPRNPRLEFLEHKPRSMAYGYFLDEAMSCVGEYCDYPEEEGWITVDEEKEMITIKTAFFQETRLDQIPGIAAFRVRYETLRENSTNIEENPDAKLTIHVTAEALNDNSETITVDEKEGSLLAQVVVRFMLDPTSDTFDQICNWKAVVRLLRSAVNKAFRRNGDFNFKPTGFVNTEVGRVWVNSYLNGGDYDKSRGTGLRNSTGHPVQEKAPKEQQSGQ